MVRISDLAYLNMRKRTRIMTITRRAPPPMYIFTSQQVVDRFPRLGAWKPWSGRGVPFDASGSTSPLDP
jgi:hypothetical protein